MMRRHSPWWRGATLYQVYVRSFQDSNGDGVGDLLGVRQRLDYLEWLGIDGVWLSPIMRSPNEDWGYDVSDYTAVHPELGTLEDLDRLVEDAGRRGISVLLDLVPSHTSNRHPWFVDAVSGKGARHRDYYVWAAPRDDRGAPNNWSMFSGNSAWSMDTSSGEYYLNGFLPDQPDLNWWHPPVHEEFEKILRFWFDRGIAGFRIDVAHALYKDAQLRDDPPTGPDDHPVVRQGRLRSVYSGNRPEVHEVYRRWRQIAASYDPERLLLGETWVFDFEDLASYYGRTEPELHLAFNFPFFFAELRARELAEVVEATVAQLPIGATPVWTASNHDGGRFPTRWCHGDTQAVKAALLVLATLPGTAVLYQGDELGMTDVEIPVERRLDPVGRGDPNGPVRDRCRTPMPWSPGHNAGFTAEEACPWLPLGEHGATNVESERADPASVLNFWRKLAALRRAGKIGAVEPLERLRADDQVWAYRVGESITIANLSGQPARIHASESLGAGVTVSTNPDREGKPTREGLDLDPWEAMVSAPR